MQYRSEISPLKLLPFWAAKAKPSKTRETTIPAASFFMRKISMTLYLTQTLCSAEMCVNSRFSARHEYLKRQLDQKKIGYQALDNGILSCQDPSAYRRSETRSLKLQFDSLIVHHIFGCKY